MHPKTIHALGVAFYNEDLESACLRATEGALVTAPSGPAWLRTLLHARSTVEHLQTQTLCWLIVDCFAYGRNG